MKEIAVVLLSSLKVGQIGAITGASIAFLGLSIILVRYLSKRRKK